MATPNPITLPCPVCDDRLSLRYSATPVAPELRVDASLQGFRMTFTPSSEDWEAIRFHLEAHKATRVAEHEGREWPVENDWKSSVRPAR